MTKAILTQKAVGLVGAIAAGIGLWRFTSGDWLSGIVFVAAVAGSPGGTSGTPGACATDDATEQKGTVLGRAESRLWCL